MKYLFAFTCLLMLSSPLQAEELVRTVSFSEDPLTISTAPGSRTQLLAELDDPRVSSPVYALKGMVRYDNVEGDGYLQLDNHFGPKGTFFTKSLASSGPLKVISGSSDWRPFVLPFYANSGDQVDGTVLLPEKLTLTLFLPGPGTVSIRDVALFQYASGEDPLQSFGQSSGQWFGNRSAGLLGGIGGGLLGLWGALIGVLSSRGKARRFTIGSANALLFVGIASIAGGVAAFVANQPYAVYYTLLLIGTIIVVVIGKLRGGLSAQYEQLELKKMQSMDV